jgi:hypothetical protein
VGVGLPVTVAEGDVEGGAVTWEASDGDTAVVGVGAGAVAGDEHAPANAKAVASASRRAPMTVTLSTHCGQLRYEGGETAAKPYLQRSPGSRPSTSSPGGRANWRPRHTVRRAGPLHPSLLVDADREEPHGERSLTH